MCVWVGVYKCMNVYINVPICINLHPYLYNYQETMCMSLSSTHLSRREAVADLCEHKQTKDTRDARVFFETRIQKRTRSCVTRSAISLRSVEGRVRRGVSVGGRPTGMGGGPPLRGVPNRDPLRRDPPRREAPPRLEPAAGRYRLSRDPPVRTPRRAEPLLLLLLLVMLLLLWL